MRRPASSRTAAAIRSTPLAASSHWRPVRPRAGSNAAGRVGAGGICRRFVGQHDDGPPSVTDRGEQSRRLDRGAHARFIRTGIGQTCRDKRANHGQAPLVQPLSQFRGLGGHETPVAELGTGVSACGDLVEHLFITRTGALRLELQHAPRAGALATAIKSASLSAVSSQHGHVARGTSHVTLTSRCARRRGRAGTRSLRSARRRSQTSATGTSHHDS